MNNYRVNTHYAKALFMLADEAEMGRVADDMRLVSAVCAENRELAVIFANPVIRPDKKSAVVRELFGGRVSDITMAFLLFVVKKNRSVNLRGICDSYLDLYREHLGIVKTDLVTHQPVDDEASRLIVEMVEHYTGKRVELHAATDARMLGGFKLEFDHNMYDARLRTKLLKMRQEFAKNDYESKL